MATLKKKRVHILIDKNFYDNIFEPERKKLSLLKGVNFTIPNFTEYLAKKGAKIKYSNKKFSPKLPRKPRIKNKILRPRININKSRLNIL